ncbi:uncharacterized protein At1g32220, chloroplastic isoform X2 [Cannabis sativa]|uniref:uncharacterized protein At1g32220, chloroplastic isoform X2 n=1 Tax=Cannabis sativa TaxID=3483 RepID=UPI0029CA3522|nr:uncharacterized protein At1g32220, chloroplastic isoform X2 [Cannabis sativa]
MASVLVFPATSTSASFLLRPSLPTRFNSLFHNRSTISLPQLPRFGVRCSYAEASINADSNSATIDVVADVRSERIVVLGGSGFVGSAICKAAVSKGIEVVSVSRSGRPTYPGSWIDQVSWIPGIPKFVFISVHDYNLPSFLLSSGYFAGKRKAESEVLSKYPNSGIVLRPGFIYGKRRVDSYEIPLDLVGEPLERILRSVENFTKPLNSLPASDLILAPPVSVDDVALAAINSITDDDFFGVYTIDQIKEAAKKVKV